MASDLRLRPHSRWHRPSLSYTGPKILLCTFLSKTLNFFLSLFVSVQVSDAYVNTLSIIVLFSLSFSLQCLMQKNNYEFHIIPSVEETRVRIGVLEVVVPVYCHLKSSGAFKPRRKNKYARY